MILQLLIFALLFLILGIIFLIKKKHILGYMFILLSVMGFLLGIITISVHPQTWPF